MIYLIAACALRYWQFDTRHQQRLLGGSAAPRSPQRGVASSAGGDHVAGGVGGVSSPSASLFKGKSSPPPSPPWGVASGAAGRGALPAIMSQSAEGASWRRIASNFTGVERDPEMMPSWIVDVVLRGAAITSKVVGDGRRVESQESDE